MILSDEVYADLDEFMEAGRKLGHKHPELTEELIIALYVLFKAFYAERGIDPAGRKFKTRKENDGKEPTRWF